MDKVEDVELNEFLPEDFDTRVPRNYLRPQRKQSPPELDTEEDLRRAIQEYYLHKQLANALLRHGDIPQYPTETIVGVGFVDIANYSYLSKWLSPRENQNLLNGLYSAFNSVLKRRGGFLNKMEGDSLMFHYGGIIDPNIQSDGEGEESIIAEQLFYTCVEIQRACYLFNAADRRFLEENTDKETVESIQLAYNIISTLRENLAIASEVNALFQVQVRVGASIGEVSIGNFGPSGKKQWDIIGQPVIEARRMESTAPVGGVRISKRLYETLFTIGVVEDFYKQFKKQAKQLKGHYQDITLEELFKFGTVILKDKRDEQFESFSVQVNPQFPEVLVGRIRNLLEQGEEGVDEIIDLIKYYRGNRLVINAIESFCGKMGIELPLWYMLNTIYPKKFTAYRAQYGEQKANNMVARDFSLFELLKMLGNYQDILRETKRYKEFQFDEDANLEELSMDYNLYQSMKNERMRLIEQYKSIRQETIYNTYFYKVTFPLIFACLRTAFVEFQHRYSE